MKLQRTLLVIANVIISACSTFDDSGIQQQLKDHESRIARLEQQCAEMKSNISALQTLTAVLQSNDVVTGISQIKYGDKAIGFNVTFAKGAPIQIYFGSDSATPTIGVKQEGGIWYWTLNGEWLKDESGNRIVANGKDGKDGVTPQMKIEDDYWYISYDEGKTWTKLTKATSEPGDGVFKFVSDNESEVVFTLQDGTQIIIPKYKKVNITFEYEQGSVIFEDTKIPYTITGEANEYEISALCFSSSYKATIEKTTEKTGFINISVKGAVDSDSQIAIVVTAPDGESTTRVLQIGKCIFECACVNGTQYVDPDGGQVTIDISSNLDFTAEVNSEWLSISPATTKSPVKTTRFILSYSENASAFPRCAMVVFKHNDKVIHEHMIYQNGLKVNIRFGFAPTKLIIEPMGVLMFKKGDKISVNKEVFEIQADGSEQILEVPYCAEGYDVVYPAIHISTDTDPLSLTYERILNIDIPYERDDSAAPLCYAHIGNDTYSGLLSFESGLIKFTLTNQNVAYAIIELPSAISGKFACYVQNGKFSSIKSSGSGNSDSAKILISKDKSEHYISLPPIEQQDIKITFSFYNDSGELLKVLSNTLHYSITKGSIFNFGTVPL